MREEWLRTLGGGGLGWSGDGGDEGVVFGGECSVMGILMDDEVRSVMAQNDLNT